jgi:ribosomal protein L22
MSAEQDKDDVTPADAPEAKKPAAKKAAAKKPAKAAAKGADVKAGDGDAGEGKKPAAKKAAKKPAATKAPVASEKKGRAKADATRARRRVVRAHARYVRTSARKARMVCGHLRGKSVQEARAILAFTSREVARDWSKLLESAVANAESNHELLEEDLVVREAYADEGPTIKRFRPRAMGRATPIRKRTSHLTIALTTETAKRTTKRNG